MDTFDFHNYAKKNINKHIKLYLNEYNGDEDKYKFIEQIPMVSMLKPELLKLFETQKFEIIKITKRSVNISFEHSKFSNLLEMLKPILYTKLSILNSIYIENKDEEIGVYESKDRKIICRITSFKKFILIMFNINTYKIFVRLYDDYFTIQIVSVSDIDIRYLPLQLFNNYCYSYKSFVGKGNTIVPIKIDCLERYFGDNYIICDEYNKDNNVYYTDLNKNKIIIQILDLRIVLNNMGIIREVYEIYKLLNSKGNTGIDEIIDFI
jgi:hypothetical protein